MTKHYLWSLVTLLLVTPCFAQNVAINEDGSLPHPNAILDIKSTTKGILIPRMSTADRLAIAAPKGMLVFDTTTNSFWYCDSIVGTYRQWTFLAKGNYWGRNGNIADDYSFIGTWNDKPLQIRVNMQSSGEIHPSRKNAFWGFEAGHTNSGPWGDSTGWNNTAIGSYSLYSNRSGSGNVALGEYSLYSNTSGGGNTASGGRSLYSNTTGVGNTSTGQWALLENTTGNRNTAMGMSALENNYRGTDNTAVGSYSLFNTINGSNNTAIGSLADVAPPVSNATAIGAEAWVNTSNKVRIGNSAVTSIEGQVPFTVPSDGRFKFSIKEDVKGLDFILQLRPVTYQFDVTRFETQLNRPKKNKENKQQDIAMEAAYKVAADIRRSGFIAQEVEKAADKSGYNFSGIIPPQSTEDHYSLSYESFVVPLVKAVQELSAKIDSLEKKNEMLEKKNEKMEKENEKMKQLLNSK